ncbi:MAG TPA: hypothetical protein VGA10_07220 [Thermoanaerobaculia bacterium]
MRTAKGVDSEIPRPAQRGEGGAKRRVRGAALACILLTTPALAHSVVADDRNNDNGLGIVVTIVLPPTAKFVNASGGNTWRCTESKLTVTCSGREGISSRPIAMAPAPSHRVDS